jgi:hypothetical protein
MGHVSATSKWLGKTLCSSLSDFADQYPSAAVIGSDLSPIQPKEVPPNLMFEVDDCTLEWVYTEESFDYIHVRSLYGCISDWPSFYGQVYR